MSQSSDFSIIVAIISLISAIVVALVTAIFNKRNEDFKTKHDSEMKQIQIQEDEKLKNLEHRNDEKLKNLEHRNDENLKRLEHELELKRSERNARLDYEYEARKRLYHQFEPLLFLLMDYSDSAFHRIYELGRAAKTGNLESNGWLSKVNYFMVSTIYKLLLPIAVFKLMQRQLTLFDLELIPIFKLQYLLSRSLYFTFAGDITLASCQPGLEYRPETKVTAEELAKHPEVYVKQGIYIGIFDNLIESLIVTESSTVSRPMTFGEFRRKYFQTSLHPDLQPSEQFQIAISLFLNFHPKTRPILWRILLTQAHVYKAMKIAREIGESQTELKVLKIMPIEERKSFDWRKHPEEADEEDVIIAPFSAVNDYLINSPTLAQFTEKV